MKWTQTALIALVIGAGALLPLQALVNGRLGVKLGNPFWGAALQNMLGAAAMLGVIALVRPATPSPAQFGATPLWAWAGGLMGMVYVIRAMVAAGQPLGATRAMAGVIVGQLVASMLLDQFGVLHERRPVLAGRADRRRTVDRRRLPDPAARLMTLSRGLLIAAILAGASFMASWGLDLPPAAAIAWKGSGVALLALYAASRAKSTDGWLLVAVMALGALGDVLLETSGLTIGALAFLAGHVIALALYLRNRRPSLTLSQALLAVLLVPATVFIAFLLPSDRSAAPGIAFYSLGLSLMAAAAWTSRFPRYRVGLGALMFLDSDLLIFARAGPLHGQVWVNFAVWILYLAGQALICTGVVGGLAKSKA